MYYNKEQIKIELLDCHKRAMDTKLKPLTSIEEAFKKLEDNDDVVGYFWVSPDETAEVGLKMSSRMYIRIENDLYTDDRFAIDLYHSQIESKTVGEVIRERQTGADEAKKNETVEHILKSGFKDKLINKLNSKSDD